MQHAKQKKLPETPTTQKSLKPNFNKIDHATTAVYTLIKDKI